MPEFKRHIGNYRSFVGNIRNLEREDDFNYRVEVWLLDDRVNNNNWQFINLEAHRALFAGTPLLTAYVGGRIGDGHNYRMVKDQKTGEERPTFIDSTSERIVGSLSENPDDIRLEQRDGHTWVVGRGRLWRWYAPELVEKIAEDALQGRNMSVSIETLVTESHMNGDVEVEESYIILGTTILGDHVQPAVNDARILALEALENKFNELKVRAASYGYKGKGPNTSCNKGVRNSAMNKRSLAAMQSKFPDYTILKMEGEKLCLMANSDHTLFTYTVLESDHGEIISDRITPAMVNAEFPFENGRVEVDVNTITDNLAATVEALTAENQRLSKEVSDARAEIDRLNEIEGRRRKQAIRDAMECALEKFNEDAPEDEVVEASAVEALEESEFVDCVDSEGAFCGDKKAADALLAKCAAHVIEVRRAKVKAQKKVFAWESGAQSALASAGDPLSKAYSNIVD